jgi:hypothetical protein
MTAIAGQEQAETLALQALGYLAADEDRLSRFVLTTGLTPQDLQQRAGDPMFLAGVLDYLMTDDALVVAFAEENAVAPETVMAARRRLPGLSDEM